MVGVRKYPRARLTELCFGILASFAFPADADQFHFGTERALAPGAISWDAIDPSRPVQCSLSVQPSVATDNDRLLLIDLMSASRDTPVLLRGVRYNGFGPQAEPEQIYCGCQHVSMNFVGDGEGGGSLVPGIRVPMDAPSGHYSVEILPSGSTCGSGGIRASCQAPAPCVSPTLTVVPSHVVAVMKALKITDNGEDNDINPAEMQFYFAGVSGALVGEERLVNWSGGFPAGPTNASHLTNDDHTVLSATVPLFSGRESLMSAAECREECVAAAASEEQQCTAVCASNESLGRYDDKLEFGISGFESDSSPSKAWGFLAGVAASAASCYLFQSAGGDCTSFAGVTTSGGIGAAVAAGLNKYLTDDDDKFGSASSVMQHNTNDWGIGVTFPPVQFVDGSGGDVAVDFEMRRIAAPSLIHYSVRL